MNLKSDQRDLAIKTQLKKTQYHALKTMKYMEWIKVKYCFTKT